MEYDVYLSLGSNQGNRKALIHSAMNKMKIEEIDVELVSSFYRSDAWGYDSENEFLNIALKARTTHSPIELLNRLQKIEDELGKEKKDHISSSSYSDRPIDIDIIFYSDWMVEKEGLVIPHLHFQDRNFVLIPLSEIAPDFEDPRARKTIVELLKECQDENKVHLVS